MAEKATTDRRHAQNTSNRVSVVSEKSLAWELNDFEASLVRDYQATNDLA